MRAQETGSRSRRPLTDPFGRTITYLRVSVTDRCDFRCHYCMAEDVAFVPREDLLSIEELDRVCSAFVARGVRKLRLTGGEPLVRRGIVTLIESLSRHLESGALDELTLTTNGSQLARYADQLAAAGVERVNVSLDTLDAARFKAITGQDRLDQVLDGIRAAKAAGLGIKINKVALPSDPEGEVDRLLAWCGETGCDMTLIEAMPFGEGAPPPGGADAPPADPTAADSYLSLAEVRRDLETRWSLADIPDRTGGPARYVRVEDTGRRLGLITPLTSHFCETCNRVRLTCTGRLYLCLGREDSVDLREPLRSGESDAALDAALDAAVERKPQGHEFLDEGGARRRVSERQMNLTGG